MHESKTGLTDPDEAQQQGPEFSLLSKLKSRHTDEEAAADPPAGD